MNRKYTRWTEILIWGVIFFFIPPLHRSGKHTERVTNISEQAVKIDLKSLLAGTFCPHS
jgi:hypothetical protein